MTSNHRAHQCQAIVRTIHIVLHDIWCDLKHTLMNFKPSRWKWKYEIQLYDIHCEAHEAEVQEARERIMADEWQSLHDKF